MGRKNRMQNRIQNRPQNRIGKTTKMLSEHHTVHRGDVFFAELGYHEGTSIQNGCRPVLVLSNDKGNYHSNTISIIPLTGCFKRPDLPCHILLYPEDIKNRHQRFSVATVLTEQVTTI